MRQVNDVRDLYSVETFTDAVFFFTRAFACVIARIQSSFFYLDQFFELTVEHGGGRLNVRTA